MKYLLICALSLLVLYTNGQDKVSLDDLKNHVGKTVQVRGKVSQISKIGKGKTFQAIIYVGGVSTKEKLSVLVRKVTEGESDYILKEKKYINSMAIVKGKVELVKGIPQIAVDSADEIMFIIDEEVTD